MFKKNIIIAYILFAYTIVLGHSIIPHHHHDSYKEHATHPKSAAHHHDHEENNDRNDNTLSHDFANYIHSSESGDNQLQPLNEGISPAIITSYVGNLLEIKNIETKSSPPLIRCTHDFKLLSEYCLSSKGLRAPPILIS